MYQELLTVDEIARLLKVSKSSIYHRVEAGTLPAIRIGSAIRINPLEVGIKQEMIPPPVPTENPKLLQTKTLIDRLLPEVEKAFSHVPEFGEISFRVIMHNGEPVRIETATSVSMLISPESEPKKRETRQ